MIGCYQYQQLFLPLRYFHSQIPPSGYQCHHRIATRIFEFELLIINAKTEKACWAQSSSIIILIRTYLIANLKPRGQLAMTFVRGDDPVTQSQLLRLSCSRAGQTLVLVSNEIILARKDKKKLETPLFPSETASIRLPCLSRQETPNSDPKRQEFRSVEDPSMFNFTQYVNLCPIRAEVPAYQASD